MKTRGEGIRRAAAAAAIASENKKHGVGNEAAKIGARRHAGVNVTGRLSIGKSVSIC